MGPIDVYLVRYPFPYIIVLFSLEADSYRSHSVKS